jgi:hypothetical protein
VQRRVLLAVLALVVAGGLAVPATALGIHVHVRVEGAKRTIFGAGERLVEPFTGRVTARDGTGIELSQPTALGALEAASRAGEFFYGLQATSFGPFVDQIGRNAATDTRFWVFKVNGAFAPVGAADLVLRDGDSVLWYLVPFDPSGLGPDTLDLAGAGRGCVRAFSVDANGVESPARDVTFRVDGKRVESAGGRLCPSGHWHTVRATKEGAIRSEVMRRFELASRG